MIETLYPTLMHGSNDDVCSLIYRGAEMSPAAMRMAAGLVLYHLRAADDSATLTLIVSMVARDFTLFVLGRSWTDGETPLMIHTPTSTIAGIMTPFNDLAPLLSSEETETTAVLSTEWIARRVTSQ